MDKIQFIAWWEALEKKNGRQLEFSQGAAAIKWNRRSAPLNSQDKYTRRLGK